MPAATAFKSQYKLVNSRREPEIAVDAHAAVNWGSVIRSVINKRLIVDDFTRLLSEAVEYSSAIVRLQTDFVLCIPEPLLIKLPAQFARRIGLAKILITLPETLAGNQL